MATMIPKRIFSDSATSTLRTLASQRTCPSQTRRRTIHARAREYLPDLPELTSSQHSPHRHLKNLLQLPRLPLARPRTQPALAHRIYDRHRLSGLARNLYPL